MKKSIYILTFMLLGGLQTVTFGQAWENFSNVTAITDAKPAADHIWTSCKGGVVDFNTTSGEKTVYTRGMARLPSASIEQVAVNSVTGVIWVGTYDAGVVEWDGSNFITYDFPAPFHLSRMKFDSFGNLWLQTELGLYKFDCYSHTYTFINSVGGAGWDFDAWDFDITPDDHVLIFTGTTCLVIDAVSNMPIDSFPNSDSPIVLGCSPTTVRIYGVDEDTYLINNSGFLEFQFKDGTYADANAGLPEFAFVGNIVRGADEKIYAFVNGNEIYKLVDLTWVIAQTADTYMYDKLFYTDGTDFYMNQYSYGALPKLVIENADVPEIFEPAKFEFTSNNIQGLIMDESGVLYMASGSKIYTYDEVLNTWNFYLDVPTIYGSLYDIKIVNGMLYVVDYGNMIEYYNGTEWTHIPVAAGYSSIYIFDYDVTADGVIYFVNDDGLFKSEAGVTTLLIATAAIPNWFTSIKYDETRDLLWLGRSSEIVKYDFITQEKINSMDVPAMAEGSSIQAIETDAAGNVWFGANNDKAYMFNGTDWTDYTVGNAGDFVIDFAFNDTKTYFGLTDGNEGCAVYESADESWMYYNTMENETLFSNTLNYVITDAHDNVWIAHSDAGLSVLRATVDPVDIETENAVNDLLIYPNPASDVITLENVITSGDLIQIMNVNGSIVISVSTASNNINISNLPNGVYLLKMIDSETGLNYTSQFSVSK